MGARFLQAWYGTRFIFTPEDNLQPLPLRECRGTQTRRDPKADGAACYPTTPPSGGHGAFPGGEIASAGGCGAAGGY